MKMNKRPLPLSTICSYESRVDPTPDYQRPPAWSRKQKQLLLDTILREYDIPKMYWRAVRRADGIEYEVVDGQQRIRTIWEFRKNVFPLAKDMDDVRGHKIAGMRYDDLPLDVRTIFDAYPADVVIVEDAMQSEQEDEVRDMFLRLQNGTILKAQEKRNAMTGSMRDFVKAIARHPFFEKCRFTNSRFTYDHLAAQTILIEMEGGPTSVRDADLNRLYEKNSEFETEGKVARKIKRVFDFLNRAFPEKTPELERYNVINLYCLVSVLIDGYVCEGLEDNIREWFLGFETERKANEDKDDDSKDVQLVEYRRLISQSTDSEESIAARLEFFERRFFDAVPNIEPKDPQRGFSHEQRLAIFRRDSGICQLKLRCDGVKVGWEHWHADHKLPHSKGGKSVVSNGQVACPDCNFAKGATTTVSAVA
ncbi:DUF262 domain-containing protein [Bradyrhizobium manausense]|uniref:HNH endonuclease family protein n=1 Tax=Bradyrhizobium manausense TaxID=989370 RepID=UPI001BA83380|nr:DUF262 domain-containing protein [Bradyrhizobium manausense]MBR1090794.1 DUF262 domain-containing protein [Bradyrhizobium manausense]